MGQCLDYGQLGGVSTILQRRRQLNQMEIATKQSIEVTKHITEGVMSETDEKMRTKRTGAFTGVAPRRKPRDSKH
jgi:hypothetical protein